MESTLESDRSQPFYAPPTSVFGVYPPSFLAAFRLQMSFIILRHLNAAHKQKTYLVGYKMSSSPIVDINNAPLKSIKSTDTQAFLEVDPFTSPCVPHQLRLLTGLNTIKLFLLSQKMTSLNQNARPQLKKISISCESFGQSEYGNQQR